MCVCLMWAFGVMLPLPNFPLLLPRNGFVFLVRNLFIVGLSFFCGLAIPDWLRENNDAIQTGSTAANQILNVLLSTSMFVGGIIAMVLDNTVPGNDIQGQLPWFSTIFSQVMTSRNNCHGFGQYCPR